MSTNEKVIKEKVKEVYGNAISQKKGSCCTSASQSNVQFIGYQADTLKNIPKDSVENSFGCGNPLAFAEVKEGDVVLDIGSGAGIDTFIASKSVGETGKVYGLDMTPQMIEKAKENAKQSGITNVEYVLGEADNIPLADNTVDWVISNCVINLAPDKKKVFKEIYRVLKPGGRLAVSDILADNLPSEILENDYLYASCVAGAISEEEYVNAIKEAGFQNINIPSKIVYDKENLSMVFGDCFSGEISKSDLYQKYKEQIVGKICSAKIEAVKLVK